MKRYEFGMLVAAVLLVAGCASTQEVPTRHVYHFQRGAQEYEIISMSRITGEGANYLVEREDGTVRMSARDDDQDGKLDVMVAGEMRLHDANAIYEYGIAQAEQERRTAFHLTSRVYTAEQDGRHYMIKTYLTPGGGAFNRFFAQGDNGAYAFVVVDREADGQLDDLESGDGDLEALQQAYDHVIGEGMKEDCVHVMDGQYIVEQRGEGQRAPVRVGTEAPSMR